MKCRIGITTNLEERRQSWKSRCIGFEDWKVLAGPFSSRESAQRKETELAKKYGCVAHPGGPEPDNPNAKWYVYYFRFVREQ